MPKLTDEIRLLLEQNQVLQAKERLSSVLKNGKEEVYEHSLTFAYTEPNKPKHRKRSSSRQPDNVPELILSFLDQLESDEEDMLEFLSFIELADQYERSGKWQEGKRAYEQALDKHLDSFYISKQDIDSRIYLCNESIAIEQQLQQGDHFFEEKDWRSAKKSYSDALELIGQRIGFEVESIQHKLVICNQGIWFKEYIDLANVYLTQNKWSLAIEYFQNALKVHREEFYLTEIEIKRWIENCMLRNQSKKQKQLLSPALMQNLKPYLIPILGIIGILIIYIYFPKLDAYFENRKESQAIAYNEQSGVTVEFVKSQDTLAALDIEMMDDSVYTDSEEDAAFLAEELEAEEPLPNPAEEVVAEELPEIQIPSIPSYTPSPGEIKRLIKADEEKAEKAEAEQKVGTFQKGRIAIIPFCHDLKDESFAKRIYMDALFVVRTNMNTDQTTVSKNLVQNTVESLGYLKKNVCYEKPAMDIAKALQAESILSGKIVQLPNSQIQVSCGILHIPSLRSSKEIVLVDHDFQRLRNKLKKEIQQVFN